MAKLLYMSTHGTDDPTRASLAFIAANGAKEAGHEPLVALLIDGTFLMKDTIVESITPVGFPPLKEIMATTPYPMAPPSMCEGVEPAPGA